jgi:phage-related protein
MEKSLLWLHGEVKTPPFSKEAGLEAGFQLRRLQRGEVLSLPVSRPMPTRGRGCHERRVHDGRKRWRIDYVLERDANVLLEVFAKETEETPKQVIDSCRERLPRFRRVVREEDSR